MQFHGIVPPMCTPVTVGNKIDTDALRAYVQFLEKGGVHGLFPCGTTGEFASLTLSQRQTVIETVVDAADSIPVFAGCGGTSVGNVIEQIEVAEACGADVAVVIVPYFMPSTEKGVYDFFSTIANNTPLSLFIYNIPKLSGYNLSINEVERLATHEQIVGLKDTTGNILRFSQLLERMPDSFGLFQGDGALALSSLDIGGNGIIAGSANVCPNVVSKMFDSHQENDGARARELTYNVIFPLINIINTYPSLPSVKYLVGRAGPELGSPLPPLPTLTASEKQGLETEFNELRSQMMPSLNDD